MIFNHCEGVEIVSKTFCNSLDKSQNVGTEKKISDPLMMFENQLTRRIFKQTSSSPTLDRILKSLLANKILYLVPF